METLGIVALLGNKKLIIMFKKKASSSKAKVRVGKEKVSHFRQKILVRKSIELNS